MKSVRTGDSRDACTLSTWLEMISRKRWTTAHDGVNGSLSETVTERWPCRKIYLWEIKFDVAVAINGSYKPAW